MDSIKFRGLKNTFFDIIHLYGVIEHLDDPSLILSNCAKLLYNQGIIVLNVPIKWSLSYFSFILFGISPKYWGKPKKLKYFFDYKAKSHYYKYYSTSNVRLWCKNADLIIVGTIDTSYSFGIFPFTIPYNFLPRINFQFADIYNKLCQIIFFRRPAGRYFILKKNIKFFHTF